MQLTIKNSKTHWFAHFPKVLLSMTVTLLCCTACNQSTNSQQVTEATDGTATTSSAETTYRVVSNASYPPFEYLDAKGKVIGFDVDLLTAIGKEEGFDVSFQSRPWTVLFSDLENGKADIVASSVWITEERLQKYGVSTPYYSSPMSLLTLQSAEKTNPTSYPNIEGGTVAVAVGGENAAFFDEFLAAKNNKVQSGSSFLALQGLVSGKANYVSDAEVRLDYDIQQYGDRLNDDETFVIVNDPRFPVWDWGFIVKKSNTKLLEKINSGLEKVRQNGTYDEIYEKWFNKKPTSTTESQ